MTTNTITQAVPVITTSIRGVATSEFWLTLLVTMAGGALATIPHMTTYTGVASIVLHATGAVIALLSASVYTHSRTLLKLAAINAEAESIVQKITPTVVSSVTPDANSVITTTTTPINES